VESQATWSQRRAGTPWGTGDITTGHDAASEANWYAMNTEGGKWGPGYRVAIDVTGIVRDWVEQGQPNHGFWVEQIGTSQQFHTRESSETAYRPMLEITYRGNNTDPPPPVSALQGRYRNGQVFLTWNEISGSEAAYNVYRAREPFRTPGDLLSARASREPTGPGSSRMAAHRWPRGPACSWTRCRPEAPGGTR
jgi:hypothetical protein